MPCNLDVEYARPRSPRKPGCSVRSSTISRMRKAAEKRDGKVPRDPMVRTTRLPASIYGILPMGWGEGLAHPDNRVLKRSGE
jgi:hypothetical protein